MGIKLVGTYNNGHYGEKKFDSIERADHAYDGFPLTFLHLNVDLNSSKDIDDLIALLNRHKRNFQIAGKDIKEWKK